MATDGSTPRQLVLFGTGMVAEVISVYLERFSDFEIVGYTVDRAYLSGREFRGRPVVAWEDLPDRHPPGQVRLLGPLTYQRLNTVRRDRYREAKALGYAHASFLHPHSDILTDAIGDHCIILEQNVIQPFARIGNNVIIWSKNHIGHHTVVGDHTFIASMVGISGACRIGEECYLGGQVGIAHGRVIGDRCALINAAGIKDDVADDSVITGRPGDLKPFPSRRIRHLI